MRKAAALTLRRRDPREFVVGLINLVRPLNYQALSVGAIGHGSPGFVAVEGTDAVLQTVFTLDEWLWDPATARSPRQFVNRFSSLMMNARSYERRAAALNVRLASLAAAVEQTAPWRTS